MHALGSCLLPPITCPNMSLCVLCIPSLDQWLVTPVRLDFPLHWHLQYSGPQFPPIGTLPRGLVIQTRIINGEVFISFYYLVHDSGMASHSGVVCVYRCHTDDRGSCGERVLVCLLTGGPHHIPNGSGWDSAVPTTQAKGRKVALCQRGHHKGEMTAMVGLSQICHKGCKENR